MRQQDTFDEINDWALSNYASTAAPSLTAAAAPSAAPAASASGSGMLASTSTPTSMAAPAAPAAPSSPASTPAASTWSAATSTPAAAPVSSAPVPSSQVPLTPAYTPKQNININNWYRNELGRDGDAAGVAYWQSRLDGGEDGQALYKEFANSAKANAEIVKPVDWASANTYTGPVSAQAGSIADEWGKNVLGRPLSSTEQAQWDGKVASSTSPQQGQAVYQDFLNAYSKEAKPGISLAQASQIAPSAAAGTSTGTGGSSTATTGGGSGTAAPSADAPGSTSAAQIAKADLATRTVDKPTETVQGQLNGLLAENSPVLQQARADAMRQAAERGMLNSAMAASGGEDALIRSGANIASADANTYGKAADYNVAAQNQATMWNADQVAQLQRLRENLSDSAASRAQQLELAKMQDSTSRYQAEMSANTSRYGAEISANTSRYNAEMSANTARYNTDASYRQQMDSQKNALVNSIINNMDLSPDRKAAMLESLGEGTSAANGKPGTGLAGAVYVIGSTAADLQYNPAQG